MAAMPAPMAARPAPMSFALAGSISKLLFENIVFDEKIGRRT
jgi:hypothetical protein